MYTVSGVRTVTINRSTERATSVYGPACYNWLFTIEHSLAEARCRSVPLVIAPVPLRAALALFHSVGVAHANPFLFFAFFFFCSLFFSALPVN